MSSDLSERYEVRLNTGYSYRIFDLKIRKTVMTIYEECLDAEARARQLCAELNAKEAEREGARS